MQTEKPNNGTQPLISNKNHTQIIIIIIIHEFITRTSSVMILNQRHRQSPGGSMVRVLIGYSSFRWRLKVSKVGESLILSDSTFQTVGAK